MSTPQGNGLVEIRGTKQKERGFYCMKLVSYLNEEAKPGTEEYAELWRQRFDEAKSGQCTYKDRCPIHEKTITKYCHQLSLFLSVF